MSQVKDIKDWIGDLLLTYFGLDDLRNLDDWSYDPELVQLKQKLTETRNALYQIIIAYPESPIYEEKQLDKFGKDQANKMLNDLMNKQSQISRWASNYSPIGSAYRVFNKQIDAIASKVASAQQKYDDAVSAQEQYEKQIDEDNAKKSSNYQQQYSSAEHKSNIRNQLDQSLLNAQDQIEKLQVTSAVLKGQPSYNRLKEAAVDSANKALQQVKSYETQISSKK